VNEGRGDHSGAALQAADAVLARSYVTAARSQHYEAIRRRTTQTYTAS